MSRYIDWYLVELEGMTKDRLRGDRFHDLIRETEAHLRDTSRDFQASGMSEEEADLVAIERFGRVSDVAAASIDESDPRHRRKGWFVAVIAYIVSAAALGYAFTGGFGYNLVNIISWIAFIGGITFLVGAVRSRQLLWREICAITLIVFVLFGIHLAITCQGGRILLPRAHIDDYIAMQEKALKVTTAELTKFRDYKNQAFATQWTGKMGEPTLWHYPIGMSYYEGTRIEYAATTDKKTAMSAFQDYYGSSLASEVQRGKESLDEMISGKGSTLWESFKTNLPVVSVVAFFPMGIALILNLIALGVRALRRIPSSMRRKFA